jgi:hypothetical protein
VEAARQILIDALALTNKDLGMEIQIKGEPTVADNLAEIKLEGDYQEYLKQKQERR